MRRSKRQSGANSQQPPEELTLFLDRNLGKNIIADRLRSEGIKVEVHDDHLPPDAPDEEWIALIGQRGWIAITRDRSVRYRSAELASIEDHFSRVVVIRMKNATGPEIADLLAGATHQIARFVAKTRAPFRGGDVPEQDTPADLASLRAAIRCRRPPPPDAGPYRRSAQGLPTRGDARCRRR